MRIPLLSKLLWLGVGTTVAALMFGKRRAPMPDDPVQDPDVVDPIDPLDDLEVDAMSMVDPDVDVEGRAPRAEDRVHPDDDTAMADGQSWEGENWIEALETSAAEDGPRPEEPLDPMVDPMVDPIVDDEDVYGDDPPIADRGSGGLAGM